MLEQIYPFLVAAHKSGSVEEFGTSHPDPVLLVEPFRRDHDAKFRTTAGASGLGTDTAIARVRKREGANAFDMMVTVGRAANNDIQIPAPDVSKFHAYLTRDPDGGWTITDSGSTYGTSVDGRRLAPREDKLPLRPGAKLELGSVVTTFYDPPGLFAYLSQD